MEFVYTILGYWRLSFRRLLGSSACLPVFRQDSILHSMQSVELLTG